jgi:hypothetical protein
MTGCRRIGIFVLPRGLSGKLLKNKGFWADRDRNLFS